MKVGSVSRGRFAARIMALPSRPMRSLPSWYCACWRSASTLLVEYRRMHLLVVKATLADPVCRRLMTVPGVGPVTALAFRTRSR